MPPFDLRFVACHPIGIVEALSGFYSISHGFVYALTLLRQNYIEHKSSVRAYLIGCSSKEPEYIRT